MAYLFAHSILHTHSKPMYPKWWPRIVTANHFKLRTFLHIPNSQTDEGLKKWISKSVAASKSWQIDHFNLLLGISEMRSHNRTPFEHVFAQSVRPLYFDQLLLAFTQLLEHLVGPFFFILPEILGSKERGRPSTIVRAWKIRHGGIASGISLNVDVWRDLSGSSPYCT